MKYFGKVHSQIVKRGFGFIRRSDGEPDIFYHYNDTPARKGIEVGTSVEFEVRKDQKGRIAAINVVPLPWQDESPASVSAGGEHVEG